MLGRNIGTTGWLSQSQAEKNLTDEKFSCEKLNHFTVGQKKFRNRNVFTYKLTVKHADLSFCWWVLDSYPHSHRRPLDKSNHVHKPTDIIEHEQLTDETPRNVEVLTNANRLFSKKANINNFKCEEQHKSVITNPDVRCCYRPYEQRKEVTMTQLHRQR